VTIRRRTGHSRPKPTAVAPSRPAPPCSGRGLAVGAPRTPALSTGRVATLVSAGGDVRELNRPVVGGAFRPETFGALTEPATEPSKSPSVQGFHRRCAVSALWAPRSALLAFSFARARLGLRRGPTGSQSSQPSAVGAVILWGSNAWRFRALFAPPTARNATVQARSVRGAVKRRLLLGRRGLLAGWLHVHTARGGAAGRAVRASEAPLTP
jgi:hypothetical protein